MEDGGQGVEAERMLRYTYIRRSDICYGRYLFAIKCMGYVTSKTPKFQLNPLNSVSGVTNISAGGGSISVLTGTIHSPGSESGIKRWETGDQLLSEVDV